VLKFSIISLLENEKTFVNGALQRRKCWRYLHPKDVAAPWNCTTLVLHDLT